MFLSKKMRSLTQTVDDEIHRAVRREAPGKYWAFRLSDLIGKAGLMLGTSAFILYVIFSTIAQMSAQLPLPESIQEYFVKAFVGFIIIGFLSRLIREVLLKELEPLVRCAAADIAPMHE